MSPAISSFHWTGATADPIGPSKFLTTAANSSGRVGLVRYTSAPVAHQLVKQLRQLDTSNARFIPLTGYGQRKDKDRALAAAFEVQLPKLVNPQVMLETPHATPVAIGKN